MWHVKINYTDDSSRKKIVHNYYPETNQLYASEVCTCGIASLFLLPMVHTCLYFEIRIYNENIILLMMFHDEEQWKSVVKHRFSLVWCLIKNTVSSLLPQQGYVTWIKSFHQNGTRTLSCFCVALQMFLWDWVSLFWGWMTVLVSNPYAVSQGFPVVVVHFRAFISRLQTSL